MERNHYLLLILKNLFITKFFMNWNKYLSTERMRKSSITSEQRREHNDFRTDIESDFGRVIFSSACRRLHDKTQVFPLTTDDNIHSRLTHSMEVMNIGQSFVFTLSESDDFKRHTGLDEVTILRDLAAALKVACLVHDIGNPPFGHFGEDSLQSYFKELFKTPPAWMSNEVQAELKKLGEDNSEIGADYTEFDGNAEGLRVLTKLQFIESLDGLNLTCASLGAFMKYPNAALKNKNAYIGLHKHGVLTSEKEVLDKVVEACGLSKGDNEIMRHPLSFLMEAADSICYLTMDIEDGLKKKWLTVGDVCEQINSYGNREGISFDDNAKLLLDSIEKTANDGSVNGRKQIMNLRTYLMGYLIDLALRNFIDHIVEIEEGTYPKELIKDDGNGIAEALGDICKQYILNSREVISLEITGKSVIYGILDAYVKMFFSDDKNLRNRAKRLISKTIFLTTLQEHLERTGSKDMADNAYDKFDVKDFSAEEKLRILRDYVSCMTDKFALNHYRKLSGQQIY